MHNDSERNVLVNMSRFLKESKFYAKIVHVTAKK